MTLSDYLIIAGIVCLFIAAVRFSAKKRKKGGCCGCSGCANRESCGRKE